MFRALALRVLLALVLAAAAFLIASTAGGSAAPDPAAAAPERALACIVFDPCLLTVSISGGGTVSGVPGVSCSATCVRGPFLKPVAVSLSGSPAPGFVFGGWGGACSGTGGCAFVLSGDAVVAATFLPLLTVSVSGQGTVTGPAITCPGDCSASFALNQPVTLSATPAANFRFEGWSGGCTGTGTCRLTMSAPRSPVATFSRIVRRVSISKTGSGRVTSSPAGIDCGASCAAGFGQGTSVTLTAIPDAGRELAGWSGACSGTAATCTLIVDGDKTVRVRFKDVPVRLTLSRTGQGTVTSAPAGISCGGTCAFDYLKGTAVTLTAAAAPGAFFAGWGGDCSGAARTCTVTLDAARTVAATFRTPALTLAQATLQARWQRSKATGTVVLAGATTDGADVQILLTGAAPVSLSLGPGPYRQVLPLPAGLLPGPHVVRIAGTSHGIALPVQQRTVMLVAPPEGVIGEAAVSLTQGGAAVTSAPAGTREMFARFRFASKPSAVCKTKAVRVKKKLRRRRVCAPRTILVSWLKPNGELAAPPVKKRSTRTVTTFVRSNAALPEGLWRAVIRVGGVVVAEVEVRVG